VGEPINVINKLETLYSFLFKLVLRRVKKECVFFKYVKWSKKCLYGFPWYAVKRTILWTSAGL